MQVEALERVHPPEDLGDILDKVIVKGHLSHVSVEGNRLGDLVELVLVSPDHFETRTLSDGWRKRIETIRLCTQEPQVLEVAKSKRDGRDPAMGW